MARIREIGNRHKLSAEFESVPEVFRAIDKLGWVPRNEKASDRHGRDGDFNTFSSLDEAKDVFRNRPESIRQFSVNDDKLTSRDNPGKDVTFDVTGDYLDVDRYLEGIPEVFGNSVMGNPRTIFCTINILGSFVYYTHPEYQMAKQKRILRLVDWLESQGVRCQIVVSEDSEVCFTSVLVKEFADPFDLNHLAVAMHPDWLRRIMFLVYEQSKTWTYGYGSGQEYDTRMKRYQPDPEDGIYVYVGGYMPYGGHDNKNKGVQKLNSKFDEIEESILDIINSGMTFNDEPLVVAGESGW